MFIELQITKILNIEKFDRRICEKKREFVRFEVITAVTMKNVAFWDIRIQFLLHRKHMTSPLQSPEVNVM
jgi:hypothetical protein